MRIDLARLEAASDERLERLQAAHRRFAMPYLAIMNLGMWEIFGILAIALLVFGGKKLPELARSMGSSINQFKSGLRDEQERLDNNADDSTDAK